MKKLGMLLILFFIIISSQTHGLAEKNTHGDFRFQVYPQLPENNKSKEYYHINATPGETYSFEVIVKNDTAEALELDVRPVNAFSNHEGIFYQTKTTPSFSILELSYKLTQHMEKERKITLKPFEERFISFTVKVPNDIEGTLLGAIQFRTLEETKEMNSANKEAQLFIDKYMAKNLAIQLDITSQQKIEVHFPSVSLNQKEAQLQLSVENHSPKIVNNINGEYRVIDKNENLLFEGQLYPWKMAPMTQFDYTIPWGNRTLKPGSYTLLLEAYVNGKRVEVEKSFTIKNQQLSQIQKREAVSPQTIVVSTNQPSWVWWIVGLTVLGIVLTIIVTFRKKTKKNKIKAQAPVESMDAYQDMNDKVGQ